MTLKCCVIDDEPLACRLIASYVERTPYLELAGAHTLPDEAMPLLKSGDVDVAFLDIQMPQISGMELAKIIPERTRVVFITAYDNYAIEGFRVNALDYLLKPVSYGDFLEAAERAKVYHELAAAGANTGQDTDNVLVVRSEYRLVRIPHDKILYIESLKDYIKIYIDGERHPVLTLMSMKSVEQALPDTFMRVHRSFIVNTARANIIERSRIIMGDAAIPVSDTYRDGFLNRFQSGIAT